MARKPFEPSRAMSQEEWRVLLRDSTYFWLGSVILMAVLGLVFGFVIGRYVG